MPQLVHHVAKFVSVPTLLAVAHATLHFFQAELRDVVHRLTLFRRCEASLEQLARDAEKLDREHLASADEAVLLHRQAKEKKVLKEQSDVQEKMEKVLENLPRLQQTTENLVDNTRRMYAAPCWAPHFFNLAKDNDGWCTPTHSARDMAATVAALRDAQFLSDSTLDFLKRCFLTHETAQSAAEVAANDVMAEEEQVAAKAAAKKAKKQKQKAKKQRAPQQASSNTGLLTTEAMSTNINLGQQKSRAAAEQSHCASAACVKETSCVSTAAAGVCQLYCTSVTSACGMCHTYTSTKPTASQAGVYTAC